MSQNMKTIIKTKWSFSLVAVSLISLVGMSLILLTQAATPTASIEPENGTKTSLASTISDTTASGGSAVQFSSGSSSTTWPESYYTGPAGRNIILPPSKGVLVGLHSSSDAERSQRESWAGRKFDFATASYYGYVINFDGRVSYLVNQGYTPFLSYNAPQMSIDQLMNGGADSHYRESARALAALKPTKILMRAYHEFNGDWMWYHPDDPTKFITIWRRMVDIFKAEGADNVSWVWNPNEGFIDASYPAYPGDNYVDWVASDAYNWFPGWCGQKYGWCESWENFCWQKAYPVGTYEKCLHDKFPQKPFMWAEFGTVEDPATPGRKGQWIGNIKSDIPSKFDHLLALAYFDWNYDRDWRLSTSQSSIDAFVDLVNNPYFNTYNR